jgi:hypothetical protein
LLKGIEFRPKLSRLFAGVLAVMGPILVTGRIPETVSNLLLNFSATYESADALGVVQAKFNCLGILNLGEHFRLLISMSVYDMG